MLSWRAVGIAVAVVLVLAGGAYALAREVSGNSAKIESFETWREGYDKDFREMRKEVRDIWRAIYEVNE